MSSVYLCVCHCSLCFWGFCGSNIYILYEFPLEKLLNRCADGVMMTTGKKSWHICSVYFKKVNNQTW